MCDSTPRIKDAAEKLADLLNESATTFANSSLSCVDRRFYPEGIRALIRKDWSRISALAHQIHDEEETNSALRRKQRKALAELDDYAKYDGPA